MLQTVSRREAKGIFRVLGETLLMGDRPLKDFFDRMPHLQFNPEAFVRSGIYK